MTDIDVVICCYTERRWDDLCAGVAAVCRQTLRPQRILVVVDHNDALLARARQTLPALCDIAIEIFPNRRRRGLSGARNTAVDLSRAALIAFLDDDACPEPTWLELLAQPFDHPDVRITGGRARARWPSERPAWFPPEFDWVVGCSYRGMPAHTSVVRNVHGASMLFDADVFRTVGKFQEDVGRIGTVPKGCEETELCIRLQQNVPQARVVYVPGSVVAHRVSDDRLQLRYFLRRCFAEGSSKAAIAEHVGAGDATSDERAYVTTVLTGAVVAGLREIARGRLRSA